MNSLRGLASPRAVEPKRTASRTAGSDAVLLRRRRPAGSLLDHLIEPETHFSRDDPGRGDDDGFPVVDIPFRLD